MTICDHISLKSVSYVLNIAKGKSITVLPGMNLSRFKEVHVSPLLGDLSNPPKSQTTVYKHLPGTNWDFSE
jgi:hypothetical protein